MNNTFNPRRFGLLLKKTLLERPVQMFGFTGMLLALVLILYVVAKSIMGFNGAQNLTFIWGLAGGSCFLASFVFNYFSSNAIGSSYLTLPASHFEKWLCGIIVVGVFYPVIFMIFYRVIDASFVSIFHKSLDPAAPFYKQQYESVYLFPFNGIIAWKVYPLFLLLTGAMLIGSLYFNKVGFIKTAIVICVLCLACYGLNWLSAKLLFGNISDAGPFSHVSIPVGKEEGSIDLPETAARFFDANLQFIFPGMLWILAFIRLREKEF
ncbi:MAG: hypothetical protein ABI834_04070 [Ginsengibacter sp.]